MALNKLSEKLDQISGHELGVEYDETLLWSKLEKRLDKGKVRAYWWAVAASLLIAMLFLPLGLVKESQTEPTILSRNEELDVKAPLIEEESNPVVRSTRYDQILVEVKKPLERKGTASVQIAELPVKKLSIQPIIAAKQNEITKPVFTEKDIAIIQASLESPTFENGRKVTIRAQWHSSPSEVHVSNQALKIKFYEKNK